MTLNISDQFIHNIFNQWFIIQGWPNFFWSRSTKNILHLWIDFHKKIFYYWITIIIKKRIERVEGDENKTGYYRWGTTISRKILLGKLILNWNCPRSTVWPPLIYMNRIVSSNDEWNEVQLVQVVGTYLLYRIQPSNKI